MSEEVEYLDFEVTVEKTGSEQYRLRADPAVPGRMSQCNNRMLRRTVACAHSLA